MGRFQIRALCFCVLLLVFKTCIADEQHKDRIYPGFQASQVDWSDHVGLFLLSNNSAFALGFYQALDVKLYLLVIIHLGTDKVVWTANRGKLISKSAKFVFDKNGSAYLRGSDSVAWSTNTTGQVASAMELQDSGNLVLLGDKGSILWQSFSHPTDTLLPGQEFLQGMQLKSFRNSNNVFHYLEIQSGDLVLYTGYEPPQIYWSLAVDSRMSNNNVIGNIHSLSLASNALNFYDANKSLLWQFVFSDNKDPNAFWSAALGADAVISFYDLQKGKSVTSEATKIPQNSCSTPEPCAPYFVCYFDNWCQCPSLLTSRFNCRPQALPTCNSSRSSTELLYVGEKLDYFALQFTKPSLLKSNLSSCKEACISNCSCLVLFFESSSGHCYMFDRVGSFERSGANSTGYISYMKILSDGGINAGQGKGNRSKHILLIMVILIATIVVIAGLVYMGFLYYRRKRLLDYSQEILEEDKFLDSLSGMPIRFMYGDLSRATKNFSNKIGQGGFGSVYIGELPDGIQLAVKKLEGLGQGKKEFRAEVTIIGKIRHVHLVKLRGFCAEGPHRLLVYEYMGKGSLDKWIFNSNKKEAVLDWNTRFNIALGTAKGLAYLHEECEEKIVHCDIKPENVLLDDNFVAKVSDFGLAKMMNREENLVHTTVRGTRGYLAPEWVTNHAISEKSDVYSYGMVLLEIIGGKRNFDPVNSSERGHFPSYAFKLLEEGNLKQFLDPKLDVDENDERVVTAINVALWCIQDEMHMRPPMTKVVQMLEDLSALPPPRISSSSLSDRRVSFLQWSGKEASSSSGLTNYNSDRLLSDIQLSGPR
ncbi:G-type lectin S-receptor-like serine/threonine-protein kinase SD2-5 [Malus sylvestris]|uniref:G-type lectin S-receptor-like serine/threonine-protein kinase SD2-5 n=1 Tax=Malus sylvestris TaxID=3752 RepID=UPI0021AC2A18|nr:G-type lectin S-receptor-like serine/threonine-protein kinase SD2-5 [Malus sylvestris]